MLKNNRGAYHSHKHVAKKRNISFLLTFEEWLKIWQDSGHLHERGRKRGQYCMARFGDKGPYVVGNVKIITCSENVREGNIGKEISQEQKDCIRKANLSRNYKKFTLTEIQRKKISRALLGRVKSEEHRKNHAASLRGFKHSEETKRKMSASKKGVKKSEETKQRMSEAAKLREALKRMCM